MHLGIVGFIHKFSEDMLFWLLSRSKIISNKSVCVRKQYSVSTFSSESFEFQLRVPAGNRHSSIVGLNPVEIPLKGGYLSFSSVWKKKINFPSPLFLYVPRAGVFVRAVTVESPIRGLRRPWGLIFCSVFWGLSCQALPCAPKSLATLWHITPGL